MIKAFIVDDEPLARDELIYLLEGCKEVEIIGEADNVFDALKGVMSEPVDVIFLDVHLMNESGLDLAKQLSKLMTKPEIVFATAYDEYALKAFDLSAVDYLLKPFDEDRIKQTISKLQKVIDRKKINFVQPMDQGRIQEKVDKLPINLEDRIILLAVKDILFLSAVDGKSVIQTSEKEYKVTDTLMAFERKLQSNPSFIRVHRSFIINMDLMKEIQPWFHSTYNIIMENGTSVPVSRTYIKELKKRIGLN